MPGTRFANLPRFRTENDLRPRRRWNVIDYNLDTLEERVVVWRRVAIRSLISPALEGLLGSSCSPVLVSLTLEVGLPIKPRSVLAQICPPLKIQNHQAQEATTSVALHTLLLLRIDIANIGTRLEGE